MDHDCTGQYFEVSPHKRDLLLLPSGPLHLYLHYESDVDWNLGRSLFCPLNYEGVLPLSGIIPISLNFSLPSPSRENAGTIPHLCLMTPSFSKTVR